MRFRLTLAVVLLGLTPAFAQQALDANGKPAAKVAGDPTQAISLLKAAWEAKDDAAVAARYAEPGATCVKRELLSGRKLETAQATLAKLAREKLDVASLADLGLDEHHPGSPLTAGTVTVTVQERGADPQKAQALVRIESLEGIRAMRVSLVLRSGDWKIVLASVDGIPVDDAGLLRLAATSEAREQTAAEVEAVA